MALDNSKLAKNARIANFFWMGELTNYELANVSSFVKNGFEVKVWTYDSNIDFRHLNDRVEIMNAGLILEKELLTKFKQGNQKSNLSSFSNVFRYELLKKYDGWWFDMDCICMKDVEYFANLVDEHDFVVGRERDNYTGSSVLFFKDKDLLNEILINTWNIIERNNYSFFWGEIGPDLISEIILNKKLMHKTLCPDYFYKISASEFYLFFTNLLNQAEAKKINLDNSYIVHTWNEMFKRNFVNKKKLPPKNSFLYEHINNSLSRPLIVNTYSSLFNIRFSKYVGFFVKVLFRLKIYINNVSRR